MNCEDFENNINDLTREQMMDGVVREQALVHRDNCPACAQRLAAESALSFKLRALAVVARSAAVPPLGNEVLAALREHQAPMSRLATRSRFRARAVTAAATAAAAALVLVVLALGLLRSGSPTPTAQNPNLPVEKGSGESPKSVAGQPPISPNKNLAPGRLTGINIKRGLPRGAALAKAAAGPNRKDLVVTETRTSVTGSYAVEITTDFFPVGYGSAPSLGDGGQLVRVEMPRSALVAFGLPMNVNRYDEKVKADVLFGADGMAHAIRFVQ